MTYFSIKPTKIPASSTISRQKLEELPKITAVYLKNVAILTKDSEKFKLCDGFSRIGSQFFTILKLVSVTSTISSRLFCSVNTT